MRISDWSSDVCSSDLDQQPLAVRVEQQQALARAHGKRFHAANPPPAPARPTLQPTCHPAGSEENREDRKSVVKGKRESVRVDLGVRRTFKKNKTVDKTTLTPDHQHSKLTK